MSFPPYSATFPRILITQPDHLEFELQSPHEQQQHSVFKWLASNYTIIVVYLFIKTEKPSKDPNNLILPLHIINFTYALINSFSFLYSIFFVRKVCRWCPMSSLCHVCFVRQLKPAWRQQYNAREGFFALIKN